MSLKNVFKHMRADMLTASKSADTDSLWDRYFTIPIGYLFARLFINLGWTPNMVTLLSMCVGFAGGCLFISSEPLPNIFGALLITLANILDSSDGQIARLTGSKTTLGRFLDALSTYVWYFAVYGALGIRLYSRNMPFSSSGWGGLIWVLIIFSALLGHIPQCLMAEYYRNIHLHFLRNRNGDEHDSSARILAQRAALPRRFYFRRLYLYVLAIFTRLQEAITPDTQKLLKAIDSSDNDNGARTDYLEMSRKNIWLTNILTFNTRAAVLFICAISGIPALYLGFELAVMDALLIFMLIRYERIARDLLYLHKLPGSEIPYKKPNYLPAVFFCLGVIGIISTLASTDLSSVDWKGDVLGKIGVWLPSILGIWLLIYILHTIAYAVIIGSDWKKINPLHLFRMVISGFALNNVTPVGFAGGEPYRIMELKGSIGTEKATASAFNFTIMNTITHLTYWCFGGLMFIVTGCKGGILPTIAAVMVIALMGYANFLFFKSKGDHFVTGILSTLSKLPFAGKYLARLLENKRDNLENIDREMGGFRVRKRDFIITFIIEFATRLLESTEIFILLRVMGADISWAYSVFSLASASLIGNIIFFIPMQMGAREAGFAMSLGWAGVASSVGVTASLLSRIREIVYLILGVGMLLMKPQEQNK